METEMPTLTILLVDSRIFALNTTSWFGNQTSRFCLHPKIMFMRKRWRRYHSNQRVNGTI